MSAIGTVYVVCPDANKPVGGMKTIYRQVDILNEIGIKAFVVHGRREHRTKFFDNATPIRTFSEVQMTSDDVLLLPEAYCRLFSPMRKPTLRSTLRRAIFGAQSIQSQETRKLIDQAKRIVILNLNGYDTLRGFTLDGPPTDVPHYHPNIVAMIAVSRDNEEYLRYAFPNLWIHRFAKCPGELSMFKADMPKKRQVCYMPRKRLDEVIQVLGLLRLRGALEGFGLVPIEDKTEKQVADIMGESALFLSFSIREGLPRPPMEAMLSRCLVVGYHGQGGRELFDPSFSFPIEDGNILEFVKTTERILARLREDLHAYRDETDRARAFIIENYSREQEVADITAFWTAFEKA
ncbi:MAG: hypothetical protein GC162_01460 [Planctomycetes bacterium]|nr:hypothetical protein [Planctomycetota bacterium]